MVAPKHVALGYELLKQTFMPKTTAGKASRFLTWATFRRLKEALGRAPNVAEVAEESGLSQTVVRTWGATLEGINFGKHDPSEYPNGGSNDPTGGRLDLVSMFKRGDDRV